jgi:ribosomal protein S17E
MTSDELFDYAKTVKSREDFVKFTESLNQDFNKNKQEWQKIWAAISEQWGIGRY